MKTAIRVLIVEDEHNVREVLRSELAADGFDAAAEPSAAAALAYLEERDTDVVLLDLNMPGMSGFEVLKRIGAHELPPEVIVLTANADVSTAVAAMKLGAYDYLVKPADLDDLTVLIEKAYEKKRLRNENRSLRSQIRREAENRQLLARSPAMLTCLEDSRRAARSDISVLITGESGTGKELLARFIHQESPRAERPFIAINCGAIPETMIESELFGHEKGAFTGAHARKQGLLEIANEGTLFLDEIGDMPLSLQVKLLRILETGRFFRLGGTRENRVDVRVLSATNRDLADSLQKGAFRSDLYYRISGLTVGIPPLRERKEDIPLFIDQILRETLPQGGKSFAPEAIRALSGYSWPGNVRELRNVVQRMLVLSREDVVTEADLPDDLAGTRSSGETRLEIVEREHILRVLSEAGGHREQAASLLGIHARTLRRKLREYGVRE